MIRVITQPVAQNYANEKIIEFTASDGSGGLISFTERDGEVIVELYRLDGNVVVVTPNIRG